MLSSNSAFRYRSSTNPSSLLEILLRKGLFYQGRRFHGSLAWPCSYYTKTAQAATFLNRSLKWLHYPLVFYGGALKHGLDAYVLTAEDIKLLWTGLVCQACLFVVCFLGQQKHTMLYVLGKIFVLFFHSPVHRAYTQGTFLMNFEWVYLQFWVNQSL